MLDIPKVTYFPLVTQIFSAKNLSLRVCLIYLFSASSSLNIHNQQVDWNFFKRYNVIYLISPDSLFQHRTSKCFMKWLLGAISVKYNTFSIIHFSGSQSSITFIRNLWLCVSQIFHFWIKWHRIFSHWISFSNSDF